MQTEHAAGTSPRIAEIYKDLAALHEGCIGCKGCKGMCSALIETITVPSLVVRRSQ